MDRPSLITAFWLAFTVLTHVAHAQSVPPERDWAAAQAANGSHIRSARALLDVDFSPARYSLIDAALAENARLRAEAAAAQQPAVLRRLRLDHIVALQLRGDHAQALAEFQTLDAEGSPLPAYAIAAAGDAAMGLRQPLQARMLYLRALAADPLSTDPISGLIYAHLESENFADVDQIVAQRLVETQGSVAARRTQVVMLRFTDQLRQAEAKLQLLQTLLPDDVGLWLDEADLLAQRGLPRSAAKCYRDVLAAEPTSIKARVGLADTTWAQGDIPAAASMVEALRAEAPEHPAVQRLLRAWQRNQQPLLTSSAKWGFGEGRVTGNDEMSWSTTLYSGQSVRGLRVFASHHMANAQWWWDDAHRYQGKADHERAGIGLEWTRRDLQATIEIGKDLRNGRDTVVAAGAGWQINDQLSLRAKYESQTNDFPLKGRVPGVESWAPHYLHADKAVVGIAYRWNESRRIAADLSSYHFNDGNQRHALAASWSERLYSGYGRTLDLHTAAYTSANSQRDTVYFNPKRDTALSATLTGDWLTWRHYERSFNQRLAVTVGSYRQQSGDLGNYQTYGWSIFAGLYYEHEWKLGPDRSLRYGVGKRRFPYDGKHESTLYADAALSWRF